MKAYKRILAVILALLCLSVNAFAADGYNVAFTNNNSKVTVSLDNTLSEEVDILIDETLAVKAYGKYPSTTSTGAEVKSFGSWSKGIVGSNNNASTGEIGYYCLPSAKTFQTVLTGNIEDYDLVVTFSKEAQNAYIEDIEIGLGNANGSSGYGTIPMVVKTYPLGNFGYTSAANHTEWTKTIRVRDILQNGTETRFPGTNGGTINNLTGSNINFFAVKAKYRMNSSVSAKMLQFSRIKLVSESENNDPLPSSYVFVNAFYDIKGKLVSIDYDENSVTSLTSDVPENAFSMKSFLLADMNQSIAPLRAKNEALIPVKRSVLFVGGRGAYDCSTKLHTLAQAEGYDIDVYCIYYKNRELRDHWRNASNGTSDYSVSMNGSTVNNVTVSLETALRSAAFDWVVLEQNSGYAGVDDSIFPYINYLESFVNEKCPSAVVCYNTLWPFPSNYEGAIFEYYDNDPEVMRDKINETVGYIEDETGVTVLNTNNIVYNLANVNNLSLYQKESDSTFYRLGSVGMAAAQSQIFYSLTGKKPEAANIMSAYSGVSVSTANAILDNIE